MTRGGLRDGPSWLSQHLRPAIMVSIVPFLLLGLMETLPSRTLGALAYFVAAGIWALYAAPRLLGVPYGRKPVRDYLRDIRLSPAAPVARNVALGLCLAALTLGAILAATLLYAFLWAALAAGAWVTATVVERWPTPRRAEQGA